MDAHSPKRGGESAASELGVLPILPMDTGGELRPLWIAVGLLWIVAIVIVLVNGPGRLSRRKVMDG